MRRNLAGLIGPSTSRWSSVAWAAGVALAGLVVSVRVLAELT